jgi:hypothetical protein
MAKSTVIQPHNAVAQLQDHIEAIRQQAYQEGYEAALQAVRDFAAGSTGTAAKSKTATAPQTRTAKATADPANPAGRKVPAPTRRRTGRGDNARHIAEVMANLPDWAGKAADVRKALADKGIDLPFTSIRHALGQLQARGDVSLADDGKTWSYTAEMPA